MHIFELHVYIYIIQSDLDINGQLTNLQKLVGCISHEH